MSSQWLCETFDKASDLPTVEVCGKTSLRVFLKQIKAWGECSVLVNIAFHDALDTRNFLYAWKENLFLGIVVVVHGFTPALAICQEVSYRAQVFVRNVRRLEVDRVQPSENAVVGKGHLRCDIVRRMGRL